MTNQMPLTLEEVRELDLERDCCMEDIRKIERHHGIGVEDARHAHTATTHKAGGGVMTDKLRDAAQAEQEPVAWLVTYGGLTHIAYTQPNMVCDTHYQPLYIALHRPWVGLRKATPDNMSEAVIKARERHGKPFSYEPGSTWKPHDTPVLTSWLQSKGEKK